MRSETNLPAARRTSFSSASISRVPPFKAFSTARATVSQASSIKSSASGAYTQPRVMISGPTSTLPAETSTVTTATTTPSSASTLRSRSTPCPTSPTMPSTYNMPAGTRSLRTMPSSLISITSPSSHNTMLDSGIPMVLPCRTLATMW